MNQLDGPPPVYVPVSGNSYEVTASEFTEQILPAPMPQTKVWGYGGLAQNATTGALLGVVSNSPGPNFNVTRGTTTQVKWINALTGSHMFPVDPTLHWANPNNAPMMDNVPLPWPAFPSGFPTAQAPVPMAVHVHGAEVVASSDGHPDSW